MAWKTISNVDRDYWRYRGVTKVDEGLSSDILPDGVDDLDDIFARTVLWEAVDSSSFMGCDSLVIITPLPLISKRVHNLGSQIAELRRCPADDVEVARAATAKAEKEIERQKWLVSIADMSANNPRIDAESLREDFTVAGTRE